MVSLNVVGGSLLLGRESSHNERGSAEIIYPTSSNSFQLCVHSLLTQRLMSVFLGVSRKRLVALRTCWAARSNGFRQALQAARSRVLISRNVGNAVRFIALYKRRRVG